MNSTHRLIPLRAAHLLSRAVIVAGLALTASRGAAEETPEFPAPQLDFFEKQVRPLLAKHCYECHSKTSPEIRGGLRVDSRRAMLRGGDTGPAIVPRDADESLLIDAVRYGDIYQMPPKYRLPKKAVAILEQWVSLGAPWPAEDPDDVPEPSEQFDVAERRSSHWAWQPVDPTPPPNVADAQWPRDPLDRYILSRLEQQQFRPAPDASPAAMLRRVHFDLIGLPPSVEQLQAFSAEVAAAGLPTALEHVVERLLDSPQFGERWGRHWLDLMRYAESRGHEFDYDAANAWQYRDYVIRAFNANVPYDQLLKEHLAGDLLDQPRRHPELGFNESVLGTGFWYLGEWVHSPVNIRQDEMDRMDNAVDVFSKSFLGLTVACARCHDHKFDAISQRDYYALIGFLQSSAYRQVRFETLEHNRRIAARMAALAQERLPKIAASARQLAQQRAPSAGELRAAVDAIRHGAAFSPPGPAGDDVVFADFESGEYSPWKTEGDAFGERPVTLRDIASYQGKINAVGRFFVNSHNVRPSAAKRGDGGVGKLTSPPFKIQHRRIEFWIGGGAHRDGTQLQLLVDGQVVRRATGANNNQMQQRHWDVAELRGSEARIQAVDQVTGGWGNIGFDHIVFTNRDEPSTPAVGPPSDQDLAVIKKAAAKWEADYQRVGRWAAELLRARTAPRHPLHAAALLATTGLQPAQQWLAKAEGVRLPADAQVVADFGSQPVAWSDGAAYRQAPAGELDWRDGLPQVTEIGHAAMRPAFAKLRLKSSVQREPGALGRWDRAGKTLRTASFELTAGKVHYLVRGDCQVQAVVDSHRTVQGPLHGVLVRKFARPAQSHGWRWVTHSLGAYQGHRLHIEFSPAGDQPIDVAMVVVADQAPGAPTPGYTLAQALRDAAEDEASLIAATAAMLQQPAGPEWLIPFLAVDELPEAADYLRRRQELASQVKLESLAAPAIWDGSAENEMLLVRGNVRSPADAVPRRSLEALGGRPVEAAGSGRRQLANELLDSSNPLVARVFVNRVWHHLMGRGIVPTVNNFGVLGEEPTHPALLDHLAVRFRDSGWDIKQLIHDIVMSRTYGMSSESDPRAVAADPTNRWWRHMPLRRLQGEAIRDSMLMLSGRLDLKQFGPSVPVHLTPFMQGRGRPRSGPLDGDGRRSIYISVRRNFLSPMMLAFDTPQPTTSIGRRTVSNVPAQALILLNDPFVLQQAQGWAQRLSKLESLDERLERLYLEALARQPTADERAAAEQFLRQQAEERGHEDLLHVELWTDLCHAMFNLKEFIYLP